MKIPAVFQSGCTNSYSHQQYKGNIDPQSHQHLAQKEFLIFANLVGIKHCLMWY